MDSKDINNDIQKISILSKCRFFLFLKQLYCSFCKNIKQHNCFQNW